MKKILAIIVVTSALLMLILRILTPGWFLFFFGIIDLFVTVTQIVLGLFFIKKFQFASLYSVESVILYCCIFFYSGFFLFQVDFGDTPDSVRMVLEHLTGKNFLTQYCIANWFLCIAPMSIGLLITYIVMIAKLAMSRNYRQKKNRNQI